MARIAIGGVHHETNTFAKPATDYAYFCSHRDRPPLVRRGDVLSALRGTSFAIAGFMSEMERRHDLVPLLWGSGGAGGLVTRDAFERIAAELVGELSQQMPVEGVYLDLHGAMVTDDYEDGEGELMRRVRACIGETVPVVISLDYHANVTAAMTRHADAVLAYRTYPHVDRVETGMRAARAMERVLTDGRPAGRSLRKIPFLIPLHSQCTLIDPSKAIVAEAASREGDAVVSASYLAGFPPSDIHECGPAVVVHAAAQVEADEAADAIAAFIAARESEFAVPLHTPDAAVAKAKAISAAASRPVILADTQDNPGAGGSADTTGLLAALVAGGADAVLGFLCDPQAAELATQAGEGASIATALGGRNGPAGVEPFTGTFRVVRLGCGRFRTTGPVSGNRDVDLGPMALLEIGSVRVAVTSKRMQAHDQAPFRHLGVEPSAERILALKSSVHFRGDFQPIAQDILVVEAPGNHLCDSSKYPYERLRPGVRLLPLGPAWQGVRARA